MMSGMQDVRLCVLSLQPPVGLVSRCVLIQVKRYTDRFCPIHIFRVKGLARTSKEGFNLFYTSSTTLT